MYRTVRTWIRQLQTQVQEPQTVSTGGSNSLPPYVYAIIGVGAAIIITGAIVAFNKRRKRNDEAELGSFPDPETPRGCCVVSVMEREGLMGK